MGSANTFGTFLETIKTLETTPSVPARTAWPQAEVLAVARALIAGGGAAPLKAVMGQVHLPPDVFLGAVVAGRDKGLFSLDEAEDSPVLGLTKLGRTFAE